jgi:rhodanese-related sulfurtransferase
VPHDVDIVLFVEDGHELEAKTRLARIGFDRVVGYVAEPVKTMLDHQDDVRRASRLTAADFEQRRAEVAGLQLVDVRNPGEFDGGTIADAVNIPVGQLPGRVGELDPSKPTVVFCAGGYRSSVAASVLRQAGFDDVSDVIGGYDAWAEQVLTSA